MSERFDVNAARECAWREAPEPEVARWLLAACDEIERLSAESDHGARMWSREVRWRHEHGGAVFRTGRRKMREEDGVWVITEEEMDAQLIESLAKYHLTPQEWCDQLDDCGCCMKDGYDNAPSHLWVFRDLIADLAARDAQGTA